MTSVLWTCTTSGFSRSRSAPKSRCVSLAQTVRITRAARPIGGEFLDLMIAAPVGDHLVPAPLQDSLLLLEHNIFAAWLLIFVMDQTEFS